MSIGFKHAICNEVYEKWPLEKVCASIREIGYTGIEIAPFTLAEQPGEITAAERRRYRDMIRDEGLTFVGLHWLMVSPKGLHVTTPDRALRERSWRHIRELIDLCADLGDNGVMVFGSPKQRGTVDGLSREEATRNYTEGLRGVAPARRRSRRDDPGGSAADGPVRRDHHAGRSRRDRERDRESGRAHHVRHAQRRGRKGAARGVGGSLLRSDPARAHQ